MSASIKMSVLSLFLFAPTVFVVGGITFSNSASAQWYVNPGELSCRELRNSGRSGWQGKFAGQTSGSDRHQEVNEWRCFDTRRNCATWLTKIRGQYGARVYISACDPFPKR